MTILNWCYGTNGPTQNAAVVDEQLWLAHRYRNRLIELDLIRRKSAENTARTLHPKFHTAVAAYESADAAVTTAYDDLQRSRTKARRRIEPTASQQAAIDAAKDARKVASASLSEAKSDAYALLQEAQAPYRDIADAATPVIDNESKESRKRRVRASYLQMLEDAGLSSGDMAYESASKAARAECGLYWGTYLIIEDAAKDYRKGAPPAFRKFDGHGSIAVQLQNGLTIADAIACEHTQFRMHLPELTERMATRGKDHGLQAHGEAWLRIGSDANRRPIWCVVPFVYHRPLPPDAVVKWVFLDRRRVGLHYVWKLRITLETSRSDVQVDGGPVAVHCGFRSVDGGLRIACALTPDGTTRELIMSARDVQAFAIPADLQSIRDNIHNAVKDELALWIASLASSADTEWILSQTETIAHWNKPDRLNTLVTRWRDHRFTEDRIDSAVLPDTLAWATVKLREYQAQAHYRPVHPDDLSTVFGVMEFWRKFDKHLCEWAANHSRKCIARREQLFRDFAAQLSRTHSHLVIAKVDWKKLKLTPDLDEQDTIGVRGRRVSSIASPGRLSEILREKFAGRNTLVPCAHITHTCHSCSTIHEFDRLQIMTTCAHCGAIWDQDHNAVSNTLARGVVLMAGAAENTDDSDAQQATAKSPRKRRGNRRANQ